jgi:hypothetical protein
MEGGMATGSAKLEMAPPDPDRLPMRNNVFSATMGSNIQLIPMFPTYLGAGCMFPGVSAFRGGAGRVYGTFEHINTCDEVVTCFGSNGGRMMPGQVRAGPKKHLVGAPITEPENPEQFYIVVVVQRHADPGEEQREGIRFVCSKCQAELVNHGFDAHSHPEPNWMPPGYELHSETTIGSATAVDRLNRDVASRTCPNCGTEHPEFQAELWGWRHYRERVGVAHDGWKQYAQTLTEQPA